MSAGGEPGSRRLEKRGVAAAGPRLPARIRACLFDLDGVLTKTAALHAAAWKQAFDAFLTAWAERSGTDQAPFDAGHDYATFVDGKARADGVRDFLASRGIAVPDGDGADPADAATVAAIGQRKNELVGRLMDERGVEAYEGSRRFLDAVRGSGRRTALVTASENATAVLKAAALTDSFDARVDGTLARRLGLRGKPAPDLYLEAGQRLGTSPIQAAVFEDALAGVAAGRNGGFGLVVGVDRVGQRAELRASGADLVVADLGELLES